MLHFQTEFRFMQQAKMYDKNSQVKKPKNDVFFSSLNGNAYQVAVMKQSK